MKTNIHHAATIKAADIAELAAQSRARALAAREAATELSPDQAAAVGGGAYSLATSFYDRPFPRGVLPYFKMADILTSGMGF